MKHNKDMQMMINVNTAKCIMPDNLKNVYKPKSCDAMMSELTKMAVSKANRYNYANTHDSF